jgi:septum site-determining protein MinC
LAIHPVSTLVKQQCQSMRLIGRSYLAFVLAPVPPIGDWLEELDAWLARSRGFFGDRPVVLDLADAQDTKRDEIAVLIEKLGERGIRVLGLEGALPSQCGPDLPPLLRGGRATSVKEPADDQPAGPARAPASLLIETPIRSGQSIVFMDGDITVLGSVGSGAEVVAGGSIHIYGALRGRAMAGVRGNPRARIFCQRIEAELLAIDGYYMTADEIDQSLLNRSAQAWLDGNKIMITALS